jgi:hypothetical protein
MGILFLWLVFSVVVGAVGTTRKIGGIAAFLVSIFLSPLIGFIVVALSEPEKPREVVAIDKKGQPIDLQEIKKEAVEIATKKHHDIVEQLDKLAQLKNSGALTEEEFQELKAQLIQSNKS